MSDIQKMISDLEHEWGMGGISGTAYGEFAVEIARRYSLELERKCSELEEIISDLEVSLDAERDLSGTYR